MFDLRGISSSTRTLCEASQFWEHRISDKVVYLPESINGDGNPGGLFAENYKRGDFWFEILISTEASNVVAIIRRNLLNPSEFDTTSRMDHLGSNGNTFSDQNLPVLFDPVELIELPEQAGIKWNPVRSIVWLKLLDVINCPVVKTPKISHESGFGFNSRSVAPDRELRPFGVGIFQVDQRPDGVIESRPQILERIRCNQENIDMRMIYLDAIANGILFGLFMGAYGVGFRVPILNGRDVPHNCFIKRLEVKLCPIDLPVCVS